MITPLKHMNIFFTMFLGVGGVYAYSLLKENQKKPLGIGALVIFCIAGFALQVDYAGYGVLAIYLTYFIKRKEYRFLALAGLYFCLYVGEMAIFQTGMDLNHYIYEWLAACVGLVLLFFYNDKRGWNANWLFYAYYPLHLGVIALIRFL